MSRRPEQSCSAALGSTVWSVTCRSAVRILKSKAKSASPVHLILSLKPSTAITIVSSFGGRHAGSALHLISRHSKGPVRRGLASISLRLPHKFPPRRHRARLHSVPSAYSSSTGSASLTPSAISKRYWGASQTSRLVYECYGMSVRSNEVGDRTDEISIQRYHHSSRRASASGQCDNGVAPSWCAAISRWLGIGPAPMFLRWPNDWRRGAVLSTARN